MTVHKMKKAHSGPDSIVDSEHLSPMELENAANLAAEYAEERYGKRYAQITRKRPLEGPYTAKPENVEPKAVVQVLEHRLSSGGIVEALAQTGFSDTEFAAKLQECYAAALNPGLRQRILKLIAQIIQQSEGQKISVDHSLDTYDQIKQAEAQIIEQTGMTPGEVLERARHRLKPGTGENGDSDTEGETPARK